MNTRFFLWLALVFSGPLAGVETWPRFRGDDGRGVSEVKLSTELTEEKRLWSAPLPGTGSSSPVIWGESLFVTSENKEKGTVSLVCLDAKSGELHWEQVLQVGEYHQHRFNNTAAATPAASGDVVAVSWYDAAKKLAMLSGYDHGGKHLWVHEVGPFKGKHGVNIQPEIHDGKVIFVHLHQNGGYVGAINAKDGKEIWKTPYPGDPVSYVTPLVLKSEVIVSSQSIGVVGLDLENGKEKWALPKVMKKRTIVSPINVLAGSGSDECLVAVGCKNGVYFAMKPPLKNEEPKIVWKMKGNTPYVPTPVSDGQLLYVLSDGGVLTVLDAKTGGKKYEERLQANFYASPIIAGGKLYCLSREGEMIIMETGEDFKLVSRSSLNPGPESKWADATPAVAHGRIFIRLGARLDCF